MNDSVLTRISLSGQLRGSAKLEETAGRTRVTLSIPIRSEGLYLIACGERGCERAAVDAYQARLSLGAVCALALCRGGSVLASGFTGACGRDRAGLSDRMRIMAAEEQRMPQARAEPQEKPAGARDVAPPARPAPGSEAARSIIEQARRLFGMLDAMNSPAAEEAPNEPADEFEPVPDPFPRTFPGSSWKKRPGEETLYGSAVVRGVRRELVAVPVEMRGARPARNAFSGSIIRSSDGRHYRIAPV